ncbi:hypothetical protein ACPSM1_19945 [Micromonospora chersina]|uniref:hypothetical protein n=1 Tax=Micromonospora chersina TaxID=47854 RepID=UPI003CA067A6
MSVFLLGPVLAGLAAGYLTGGRLRHLARQPLRGVWLLYAAAAGQLLGHVPPGSRLLSSAAQRWLTALVFSMVGVALLLNLARLSRPARAGVAAILAGAALNAAAIGPTGTCRWRQPRWARSGALRPTPPWIPTTPSAAGRPGWRRSATSCPCRG